MIAFETYMSSHCVSLGTIIAIWTDLKHDGIISCYWQWFIIISIAIWTIISELETINDHSSYWHSGYCVSITRILKANQDPVFVGLDSSVFVAQDLDVGRVLWWLPGLVNIQKTIENGHL